MDRPLLDMLEETRAERDHDHPLHRESGPGIAYGTETRRLLLQLHEANKARPPLERQSMADMCKIYDIRNERTGRRWVEEYEATGKLPIDKRGESQLGILVVPSDFSRLHPQQTWICTY